MAASALAAQLAGGKIEFVFGSMQVVEQLPDATGQELFLSQMNIVAANRYPLARRASTSLADIKDHR